jgi:hypothetical protein
VGPSAASGPLNGATSATVTGEPVGDAPVLAVALEVALEVAAPAEVVATGGVVVLEPELHAVSAAPAARAVATRRTRNFIVPPRRLTGRSSS